MKTLPGTIRIFSAVFAAISLVIAYCIRDWEGKTHDLLANGLLGIWVLLPPIWFIIEFRHYTRPEEVERMKHYHELARNIWIALVIVLAAIMKIKWPL